jgi:methylated-DNA-[protein]-cysteine S-methyltransferase
MGGTPFQRAVWRRLREIPYGTTITYSDLARSVGRPDVVRAVAAAVGRTPVPIVIPCHRVVAADGGLTGYLGGLHRKQALLDLERRVAGGLTPEPAWGLRQLAML